MMGWEVRHGRRYYYSARKRSGKVVKTYRGRGRMGEMAEALETEARRRRDDREEAFRAERARTSHADRAMANLDRACARAVEAALILAGFHRVNYAWRRKHVRDADPIRAKVAARG
jgi:hypothetical protein